MNNYSVPSEQPHVLLVDDDVELCELLKSFLEGEGFVVDAFHGGQRALDVLHTANPFDTIVLDIMMPDVSGLDVLQSLRAKYDTPIIMLTGRADDIDRILGLELGADDYLAKPCNPRELVARIKAVLRRWHMAQDKQEKPGILKADGIVLDLSKRSASIEGNELTLTSAEFNTLAVLMQHAGDVVSKDVLTEKVLQRKLTTYDRSIDVHVSRVRQKLGEHTDGKRFISTLRGAGYQFCADVESAGE